MKGVLVRRTLSAEILYFVEFESCALGLLSDLKETREVLRKCMLSGGYKYYKVVIGVMVVIPKMEIGNYET